MFGNIENEKNIFHRYKIPIYLKDLDIENVLVSNKISSIGKIFKYFMVACGVIIKLSCYM